MANKQKGEVPITLGDLDLVLKFDTNAIAELETALDSDYVSIMGALSDEKVSMRFVRAALFAGLQHDRRYARGLSLKKIGKFITMENFSELLGSVIRALLLMQGVDPDAIDEMLGGDVESDPTKVIEASTKDPSP